MPTLVIVGAQWGDEAKGKLVDCLADKADLVARYSGGNNAGHTVIAGGEEFRFHLIPAGILHGHITAVLGGGMVVCPKSLIAELEETRSRVPGIGRLLISASAHVVLPYHALLDRLEEEARGANKIGTTARGIGPAYQDKVGRFGIRMAEFVDPLRFRERLRDVLSHKNRLLEMLGGMPLEVEEVYEEYRGYARTLAPLVTDTDQIVGDAVREGKRVLFEGAQGTFLDLDAGTYPFVTSSHPVAGGACLGSGVGPRDIDRVLGVCKAYTTRVGAGPFPTELDDEVGERIRDVGREFGTTTGRGRRCGWLDLVLLRKSVRLNSLSALAVTRLDVLSSFESLPVATSYRLGGREVREPPQDAGHLAEAEPVYASLEGWHEDVSRCASLEELPDAARAYLRFIERETGVPVAVVSVGPSREQTIWSAPDALWG